MLKKIKSKFLKIVDLEPMSDWHTNNKLKGYSRGGHVVVPDLPVTQCGDKLISVWKATSFSTRLKFLITGKINFQTLAATHAPIMISIGEYEKPSGEE